MNLIQKTKETVNRICEKTHLSKKILLIVFLFISGIILLFISEMPKDKKNVKNTETTTLRTLADDYALALEERLTSIISAIDGVGAVRVMVTVESTGEDVYLHNFDYGENENPDGKNSYEQKDEYVIVNNGDSEEGIVVKVQQPEIRGVAVVCQGASSEKVRAAIVQTVTALLDISSARVSVAEMG